ncbi:MAG: OmpA family protein [Candidatus Calescibacterium sp.]
MEKKIILALAALLAVNVGLFVMLYDQESRIKSSEDLSLKTAKVVVSAAYGRVDPSQIKELEKTIKIYEGELPKPEKAKETKAKKEEMENKELKEEKTEGKEKEGEGKIKIEQKKEEEGAEEETEIRKIVFFESGSYVLPEEEITTISRLFAEISTQAVISEIILEGHTDIVPVRRGTNYDLSLKRAQYVANLLKNNFGVPENLIKIIGYGDTKPRFPNPNFNRRVEIVLKVRKR